MASFKSIRFSDTRSIILIATCLLALVSLPSIQGSCADSCTEEMYAYASSVRPLGVSNLFSRLCGLQAVRYIFNPSRSRLLTT